MPATLDRAFGYQGNALDLPVRDVETAVPFYETIMGFRVVSRADAPVRSALLARDGVQMGLAENGRDPEQDGCAFHVTDIEALFAEFTANGWQTERTDFDTEQRDGKEWKVFFVVAPDGLCYWFAEAK